MTDLALNIVGGVAKNIFGDILQLGGGLDSLVTKLGGLHNTHALPSVGVNTAAAESGLAGLVGKIPLVGEQMAQKLAGGFSATSMVAMAGVATAIGVIIGKSIGAALDHEDATAHLQVQLGLTKDAAAHYGELAGSLYAKNFGDSFKGVEDAIVTVQHNIGAAFLPTDEVLKTITGEALRLADAFGISVADSTFAVSRVLTNKLAPDAQSAMDLVTASLQKGLNKGGDLFSTIDKGSIQFTQFGLNGEQMMGMLSQAMDGGAKNTDAVSMALMRFHTNAVKDSKATETAFQSLGLNGKQMADDIAAGGPRANAALATTLEHMRNMHDPVERDQAALALFGAKSAALGDALYSINPDTAVAKLGDVTGAAQKMSDTLGDTAKSRIESFKRSMEENLVNFIGGPLLGSFEKIGEWGGKLFGPAWEPVKAFLGWLASTGGIVIAVIGGIALATWAWTAASAALTAATFPLSLTFMAVVAVIVIVVASVIYAYEHFGWFRDIVNAVWEAVKIAFTVGAAVVVNVFNWIVTAVQNVASFFSTTWSAIGLVVTTVWNGIRDFLTAVWNGIVNVATTVFGAIGAFFSAIWTGIRDFFVGIWNGIASFASGIWTAIVQWFSDRFAIAGPHWAALWTTISDFFKMIWNAISSFALGIWNTITGFFVTVWNALVAVWTTIWTTISTFFSGIWNAISSFVVMIWTTIANYFTAAFNAYVTLFTAIWTNVSAFFSTIWNAISAFVVSIWTTIANFFTAGFNAFVAGFQVIWTSVSTFFSGIWNAIWAFVVMIWNTIAGFFTTAFNAYVAVFTTIWNNVSTIFSNVWDGILAIGKRVWGAIVDFFRPAFDVFAGIFTTVWQGISDTFNRIFGGIKGIATGIWDGIRGIFRTGVGWVFDIVAGFGGIIDTVAGFLGFNTNIKHTVDTSRAAAGFAEGGYPDASGQLPGYAPGIDSIPAFGPGGQPYMLAGGEFIVRPEATRAIGPNGMAAINNAHVEPIDMTYLALGGDTLGAMDSIRNQLFPGSVMTSGYRPGDPGYHGKSEAIDIGWAGNDAGHLNAIGAELVNKYGNASAEIIHNPNASVKDERNVSPGIWGTQVWADHASHVHWATTPAEMNRIGGGVGFGNPGNLVDNIASALAAAGHVLLDPLRAAISGAGDKFGFGGRAAAGGINKMLDGLFGALETKDAQINAAGGVGGGAVGSAPAVVGGNVQLVQQQAALRGWVGAQWDNLYALVMRESGFNNLAQNPTSTAYGMFQFLDSTWASYGVPKTSAPMGQTIAGLNYIASRYGTPIGAMGHENQFGWYADGAIVTQPTFGMIGESGPEAILPLSRPQRATDLLASVGIGGGSSVGIEQRLDRLLVMLETNGAGATINVNDTSGDPQQTARSTVLQLRMR